MLNLADYYSFSDLFSVYRKTTDHLNFNLLMFYMYTLRFKFLKFKNLLQNQKADDLGTWYVALGM